MSVRSKRVICGAVTLSLASLIGVALSAQGLGKPAPSPKAAVKAGPSVQLARSVQLASPHQSSLPSLSSLSLNRALGLQAGQPGAKKPGMVEDVFKNIQVLKGMPVDDFIGTMGIMSAALAFCCRDCHPGAGSDAVVWEMDTPRKKTARKMVAMVQKLNKENFNGRQVVTCWTCHRGRDFPVVTMEMDTVYGESTVQLDDVLTPVTGMPPVKQILDKYIAAIGGEQRVNALTSYIATGRGEEFSGQGGGAQVEIFAKFPDSRATYLHFPDDPTRGDSTRTFDGKTGWMATPLTAVRKYELLGTELDGARLDAQLGFPGQIAKVLTNLRVGPDTSVNGKGAYVVQGNGQKGSFASLYFDRQSGLLLRIVRYVNTAIGRVPAQFDFDDYRDVSGVKMPFSITFAWLDGRQTITLTDVKVNVPIDAAKFGEPNPMAASK